MANVARGPLSDPNVVQRVAIVEREVLGVISAWLGFTNGVNQLTPDRIKEAADHAVASRVAPYRLSRSPDVPMLGSRTMLTMFEKIATAIDFERATEGIRVTPSWWVYDRAGRAVTGLVVTTAESMIETAQREVVDGAAGSDTTLPVVRAVVVTRGLELVQKIQAGLPLIETVLRGVLALRHPGGAEDRWPTLTNQAEHLTAMRGTLLRNLAVLVPELWTPAHDDGMPDLFGQGYRMLLDATFNSLIEGDDDELSLELFQRSFVATEQAQSRLNSDLAGEAIREQVIYTTEPLIDIMELSGCALLMNELLGHGIWGAVAESWDNLLAQADPVEFLSAWLAPLRFRESLPLLSPGATMRSQRRMDIAKVLSSRGVRGWSRFGMRRYQQGPSPGQSPIVTVFAPDGLMSGGALEELFVAEYVLNRPEAHQVQMPEGAVRLRRQIDRERDRLREDEGRGEEP